MTVGMETKEWLGGLTERVGGFLDRLEVPGRPGRFLPCVHGATEAGRRAALGFSCFALKSRYTIGQWNGLDPEERAAWTSFIQGFQSDALSVKDPIMRGAFLDEAILAEIPRVRSLKQRLVERITGRLAWTRMRSVVIAETKQAIATLAQVGARPLRPYEGFSTDPVAFGRWLDGLDWSRPWGAGGQSAAYTVFACTQAPERVGEPAAKVLRDICSALFARLADPETGTYRRGDVSDHGNLINGAMKILTALDWLEEPIHYPEQLIDTTLSRPPRSDGCHLVDVVYVLHRCLRETGHRRADAIGYCEAILDMIRKHQNTDDGFSYNVGSSQQNYYGVAISRGLPGSDIHGTCLLTWAIAMIERILGEDLLGWSIIRP